MREYVIHHIDVCQYVFPSRYFCSTSDLLSLPLTTLMSDHIAFPNERSNRY